MCDASWHTNFPLSGVGFTVIMEANTCILAGSSSVVAESSIHAEVLAVVVDCGTM